MMDIFYTVFIFPIEQVIALTYVFAYRVFDNPALAVLGVSFAVSVLTLPLYFMAESLQNAERDIQKSMKPMVDNIRAGFSGDERFMRLAVYYRRNKYHPLYALRSSISILIQIPFFIAAYHFLSNATMLINVSFGPIADLAKPDSLFTIHGITINVLPVIMTLVNFAASAIYVKGFSAREKIQLYGMAGVFLVLLYNSPSALVLYWTGNNVFSLVKNVIQKTKNPPKVTRALVSAVCLLFIEYVAFFHDGNIIKRLFIAHLAALVPVSLFVAAFAAKKRQRVSVIGRSNANEKNGTVFLLSALVLFLLSGFAIPSSLIRTSVAEFSFIEHIESPFYFLIKVLLQSLGVFLVWPLCVYCMSSGKIRKILTFVFITAAFTAIINTFVFPGNYGNLTELFTFSEPVNPGGRAMLGNICLFALVIVLVLVLMKKAKKFLPPVFTIALCALVFAGLSNSFAIQKEFKAIQSQHESGNINSMEPVYEFSRTGKNVVVIMLDRAIAGYLPYILEEKPELNKVFDGFTWYKNTVSFGRHSKFGVPPLFGGYDYTPLKIQERKDEPVAQKWNESLLLLPRIFAEQGYKVTVTDPPWAGYRYAPDLSIFDEYPEINAKKIIGVFNDDWILKNTDAASTTVPMLENRFIRFSFFKFTPLILRNFVYDNGYWLQLIARGIPLQTLSTYVGLDVLPLITEINDDISGTYNVIYNDLPHRAYFFQPPDYTLTSKLADIGSGPLSKDEHYHVNMAAILLVGKWLDFLREQNVYDNSRIIIVADHGYYLNDKVPSNVFLPNGKKDASYNPLLLVKDFNAYGNVATDNSFMTNADVPLVALKDLVKNPVNPWSGKPLASDKADGVTITRSGKWGISGQLEYTFDIKPDEWMHVRDNIFDPKNWSMVTIPE